MADSADSIEEAHVASAAEREAEEAAQKQAEAKLAKYREEFDAADVNKSGFIERSEAVKLFEKHNLSAEQVEQAFQHYDQNHDGKISFDEYALTLKKSEEQMEEAAMGALIDTAMDLAPYQTFGFCCCLCTACLSWIPYWWKVRQLPDKIDKQLADADKQIHTGANQA